MATRSEQTSARLGKRIEALRIEKGIKQEALASNAGISHAYYWAITSKGRNITIKTASNIADALGVDIVELFKR